MLLPPIQSDNGVDLYSPFSPFALASPPGNESTEMWTSKKRNPATTPGATDGGGALAIDGKPQNVDGPVVETTHALVNVVNPVRRWLLYFAGTTVKPSDGYAVRRLLMEALGGREAEGIRLVERDEHYVENLAASTFCLAPTGTGWGRRVGLAAQFGCIPVVVQDSVRQAFDDVLPYDAFTVRFQESDIPNIPDVLRAIPSRARGPARRAVPRAHARAARVRASRIDVVVGVRFPLRRIRRRRRLRVHHALPAARLATYVKPEGREKNPWTPEFPMRDACAMVETLSCVRVPTPVCRFPCETTVRASPRGGVWADGVDAVASGGAVCRDPNAVPEGGNICNDTNPPPKTNAVVPEEH